MTTLENTFLSLTLILQNQRDKVKFRKEIKT